MLEKARGSVKDGFLSETKIHPSAFVAKEAQLGVGVVVGPNAVIGSQVRLHDGVKVGVGATIEGKTTVGDNTQIYNFATIGTTPQDLKYQGENTELIIGKDNCIREYVNISLGTKGGGGITRIGDNNLIMVYTHIAHDCQIGNHCIFANGVQIAGHVIVENQVVFGGMSGGHQFCQFGELAMIGAGSIVVKDVPPYCLAQGDRAKISGLNKVGLRRAGFKGDKMAVFKEMFRILFKSQLTLDEACQKMKDQFPCSEEQSKLVHFVSHSERGICR